MTRAPISTYRLQISADFPLDAATHVADYLHDLGADWVYLSPLLVATSGSTHGYDVVDPTRVDPARGGVDALERFSATVRGLGLGVVVDIVPNHMGVGVPVENPWWWDVLRLGRESPWAEHFDIDWDAGGGRLRIPVLGQTPEEAAATGALRIEHDELRYHEHRYPLSPGSRASDVLDVHARQHYELVHWTRADAELNYRRFFAVNELAAVRVEIPDVFDDTHREIVRWVQAGLIDGLRVDHPDGLADPGGYLDRLADATGGCYTLVEKILERGEPLPPFWATAGTTGYDALAEIDRVLIDPSGRATLDRLDARLRGGRHDWADLIHATKRTIADGILRSEVLRLTRDLLAEHPGAGSAEAIADALAEVLACFPVYRSYLPYGAEYLDEALDVAARRRPELAPSLDVVGAALRDPARRVAVRFQQTSGMVMAKGVEDTAFYRVSRLASLTEVGGDPDQFSLDVDAFHARQQARLAALPGSMTTLSTHDTKRGEDTRARISAIAEVPQEWEAFVGRRRADFALDDGPFENLMWESIVGSWPRERGALHDYAEKAAREAGTATTWARPDEGFERDLHELVDSVFDDPHTRADVEAMAARLQPAGWSNGLAAKVLQLTGPGVPDVYQGSELWERSLVDPDNRRPVDFAERRELLARLDAGELPPVDASGAAKLLVTSRSLRARRDHPESFDRYLPLPAFGLAAAHLVAVDRGGAIPIATRLPMGLERGGGWGDTVLPVAAGRYRDAFTGATVDGAEVPLASLLERYPVALLLREVV
ncbi:MAG: malto-oligosyltrehalose synthase [Pseudolysinimonas sp.]|uniref:malto-oligosyltrehalose synthase n=1 Tax=Pseudolysinimonas sp. TaxID=2680009 RepID=UPI003C74CCA0